MESFFIDQVVDLLQVVGLIGEYILDFAVRVGAVGFDVSLFDELIEGFVEVVCITSSFKGA